MTNFTKSDRIKLTKLNRVPLNHLTISQRITKALLSERLQRLHLKRSQKRLKRAKQLLPLLAGKKLLHDYRVSSYREFRNNYFVVSKDLARKTNNFNAIVNLINPSSKSNRPVPNQNRSQQ